MAIFKLESKTGHNSHILGPTKKEIRVRLFFVLMPCIRFQVPSISHSLVSKHLKVVTRSRTNGQTDKAQPIFLPTFQSWGHTNQDGSSNNNTKICSTGNGVLIWV